MSITRVAKMAGVSSSTVSRVINNHPRVAPETAETVRKVMQKLGYTPSANRPGPKPANRYRNGGSTGGQGRRLLVLGGERGTGTPGFELLMQGVSSASMRTGSELILASAPDDPAAMRQWLAQQRVDGLFISPGMSREQRVGLEAFACVAMMGHRRRPDFGDQVMQDAYGVGELAASYLLSRGHRHLAFLNLDADHWAIHLYGHGFEFTAKLAGARISAVETEKRQIGVNWRDFAPETVDHMVRAYLTLSPRPTGLFIAEDAQTALLQPALQRAGVEVGPGGVEIVSCNNERPYLAGLVPHPATVDIRIPTIGERALELLVRRVDTTPEQRRDRQVHLVRPKLVLPDGSERAESGAV